MKFQSLKGKKVLISCAIIFIVAVFVYLAFRHFDTAKSQFEGYRKMTYAFSATPKDDFQVWLADTPEKQELGLGGVEKLADDQGMLFSFDDDAERSFWMKGMKIPIDIIWMRDNMVVKIDENVPAEPGVPDNQLKLYSPEQEVDLVLEMSAGWSKKHGLSIRDHISQVLTEHK